MDGLVPYTHPIGNIGYSLRSSGAFCKWWNGHRLAAPTGSYSHDAWAVFSFRRFDCEHLAAATYACRSSCLFGLVSVTVFDTLAHSIADSDEPHRSLENREIRYPEAICRPLKLKEQIFGCVSSFSFSLTWALFLRQKIYHWSEFHFHFLGHFSTLNGGPVDGC